MANPFRRFVLLALAAVFLAAGTSAGTIDTSKRPKAQQYQELLQKAKAKWLDTRPAEDLDRQARLAYQRGNQVQTAVLMDEAVAALQALLNPPPPVSSSPQPPNARTAPARTPSAMPSTVSTTRIGRQYATTTTSISPAAATASLPGLRSQYDALFAAARDAGRDTTDAERFAMLAASAVRASDPVRAQQMLQQAVASLHPPQATAGATNAPPGSLQPLLFLAFTPHYSGEGGYYASAAEVRRFAEFFRRQRIPGTLLFDGILIERLQREDPEVLRQIREWNLPIGYHGEEWHGPYPVGSDLLDEGRAFRDARGFQGPWSLTTGRNWTDAVHRVEERYSHARPFVVDETSRRLDPRKVSATDLTRLGGLKLVQQMLGKDVSMLSSHGLESAPEGFAFRKMSRFGLDAPALPLDPQALKDRRVDVPVASVMSVGGANESFFWYMGRLTAKGRQTGETATSLDALKREVATLDRRRPNLVLIAFDEADEETAGRLVRTVNEEVLPANPGSAWVSGETLPRFIEPEKIYRPKGEDIGAMARAVINGWRGRPPDMAVTVRRTYSLCDAFEGLARALAYYSQHSRMPDDVQIHALYGPLTRDDASLLAAPAHLAPAEVMKAAAAVIDYLEMAQGDRFVPARIAVGRSTLNAGEFLLAMAEMHEMLSHGSTGPVTVTPSQTFPPYADVLTAVYKPATSQPLCYTKGQLWTIKPVWLAAGVGTPAQPKR